MVHEHNWDDEIEAEKEKSMEEIAFLLQYELMSLWWVEFVRWQWLRDIVSEWIQRKVMRKWRRYKLIKMIGNVETQTKGAKDYRSN